MASGTDRRSGTQKRPKGSLSRSSSRDDVRKRASRSHSEKSAAIEELELEIEELKNRQLKEREGLAITKRPFHTLMYCCLALYEYTAETVKYLARQRLLQFSVLLSLLVGGSLIAFDGLDHEFVGEAVSYLRFVVWWVGLGVASSIGLGSGLHTFVLYLGPHIAQFTMKATQCGRVDLKQAVYDTAHWATESTWGGKDCDGFGPAMYPHFPERHGGYKVPLWMVLRQVQPEAILWGLGTALGELPPYFVSRAARLSGQRIQELEDFSKEDLPQSGFFWRIKLFIFKQASNFGFFTILLFASVPNPLFDLAGITCGHFLVPFVKFFSATLIGKAIIKAHIQTLFIVLAFNAHSMERVEAGLVWMMGHMPIARHVIPRIKRVLSNARNKFTSTSEGHSKSPSKFSFAAWWNWFVLLMLAGFIFSAISSTAMGYLMERHKREMQELNRKLRELKESSPERETHAGSNNGRGNGRPQR
ncbi:hypothetical protein CBR_g41708 [Chara braunii]|uniref:Vacuole membrane protein 1 n=1 Tax=Chara braunii TaxID=69332 RepID=A0A388LWG7_CHABU|nr:hypothetical protein CBR_g41708 [Chara braunii]|eukprot:GBG86646.1 hypothetical protein CBR_g41708 [Chara braunii]